MALLSFILLFLLTQFHFQGNVAMEAGELLALPTSRKLQTYIVHVKKPEIGVQGETYDLESWYLSFLPEIEESLSEQPRLLYSYRNVMTGFAARLTEEQVKAMEGNDDFIAATPDSLLPLHTTHTPDFMGLNRQSGIWKDSKFGKGVIIGVLDTGIAPGHPSFGDAGMPPPPAKWRGRCDFNATVCNNKLIGARSFVLANTLMGNSPADDNGHGTHTASTAAGTFVKNADALGNARGTAVGMAPLAHLAMYQVCTAHGCANSDILAALDAAIHDGVDVLSLSLGGKSRPFHKDSIAIGTFAAIQKGIFVSASAGNSGPSKSTLSNEAPWILTVGASTIDRRIVAVAKLGNGQWFKGESLFQPRNFPSKFLPLVYAGSNGKPKSAFCGKGSLTNINVKGKVVICEMGGGIGRIAKGSTVKNAGGAAMILINQQPQGFTTSSDAHVLPATRVSYAAGLKIKAYVNSTKNPRAAIFFRGTIIGTSSSPAMASFSSRGPSLSSPGILKPDVTGPGVNILAAWPFPLNNNTRSKSTFNVISGTSMSCPHLSGIATLIRSRHRDWSPAAIKSAIMTTATVTNREGKPILDQERLKPANLFAIGSGHVDPSRAVDPGLVYDIQPDDYISYLCGLYRDVEVDIIVGRPVVCLSRSKIPEGQLNYPSFTVALGSKQTFSRTVTNVGKAKSTYSVVIEAPTGVSVTVRPRKLIFSKVNQKVTYSVTFRRSSFKTASEFGEGYLRWVSGKYIVRSPISVKFN